MNERIKELSKQAGDYVNAVYTPPVRSKTPGKIWEDGHVGWHEQFQEKFAELIVQECSNLLFDESERLYAYSSECDNMRESDEAELVAEKCVDLITMIEEHFGVEE